MDVEIEAVDAQGRTACYIASQHGRVGVLSVLLREGGAANVEVAGGWTQLHWSSFFGFTECVCSIDLFK